MFRPILKEISVNRVEKNSVDAEQFLIPPSPTKTKSFTKQHSTTALASNASSIISPEVKKIQNPAPHPDKKQKRKKKKRRQYCEMCSEYFNSLNEHIESKAHVKYMAENSNFAEVEKIISELPKFEDFFKLSQFYQNECLEKRYEVNSLICPSQNAVSQMVTQPMDFVEQKEGANIVLFSNESLDFATELYSLEEDSYVSASCSTADTGLNFLEDTLDCDKSESSEIKNSTYNEHHPIKDTVRLNFRVKVISKSSSTDENKNENISVPVFQHEAYISNNDVQCKYVANENVNVISKDSSIDENKNENISVPVFQHEACTYISNNDVQCNSVANENVNVISKDSSIDENKNENISVPVFQHEACSYISNNDVQCNSVANENVKSKDSSTDENKNENISVPVFQHEACSYISNNDVQCNYVANDNVSLSGKPEYVFSNSNKLCHPPCDCLYLVRKCCFKEEGRILKKMSCTHVETDQLIDLRVKSQQISDPPFGILQSPEFPVSNLLVLNNSLHPGDSIPLQNDVISQEPDASTLKNSHCDVQPFESSLPSDEEFLQIEEDTSSSEDNWTKICDKVHSKCKVLYSEEF